MNTVRIARSFFHLNIIVIEHVRGDAALSVVLFGYSSLFERRWYIYISRRASRAAKFKCGQFS